MLRQADPLAETAPIKGAAPAAGPPGMRVQRAQERFVKTARLLKIPELCEARPRFSQGVAGQGRQVGIDGKILAETPLVSRTGGAQPPLVQHTPQRRGRDAA